MRARPHADDARRLHVFLVLLDQRRAAHGARDIAPSSRGRWRDHARTARSRRAPRAAVTARATPSISSATRMAGKVSWMSAMRMMQRCRARRRHSPPAARARRRARWRSMTRPTARPAATSACRTGWSRARRGPGRRCRAGSRASPSAVQAGGMNASEQVQRCEVEGVVRRDPAARAARAEDAAPPPRSAEATTVTGERVNDPAEVMSRAAQRSAPSSGAIIAQCPHACRAP